MAATSIIEAEPFVRNQESEEDSDAKERMQKAVDDRLYVLRRAAGHNPSFKLSLNDRFFFLVNGYYTRLNKDKKDYEREVKFVPFGHMTLTENRPDLKYSQHNPIKNHNDNLSRPDWKCFGGSGEI